MSDKRNAPKLSEPVKKTRQSISLQTKMEVIRRMENGQTRPNVCRSLNIPPSTVTTIMKNADKIKHSAQQSTAVNVKHVSYSRGKIFEKMEKLLLLWVHDANQNNIPLTQASITKKAKSIFDHLKETNGGKETFLGSKGWFVRFKSRSNCLNVKLCGEAASADVAATAAFLKKFQTYVEQYLEIHDQLLSNEDLELLHKELDHEDSAKGEIEEEMKKKFQAYVEQYLEAHDRPIPSEDLEELHKELDHEESAKEENEEEISRVMKTVDLQRILSTMKSLTDKLCELDDDWERSAKVKMNIIASIRPYSEILNERKQKCKRKL